MDRVQELEEQLDQSMASTTLPTASTSSATTVTNKNSLIQVLQQALHGNDDALLEHCLGTTNGAIIETTVAGMTPSFVIPFLTRVVAKFEARPARGKLLTSWIQAVIEKHASYIVSTPGVLKTLSGLHETIDARLGAFKRLLKLSGRLDLVLSQMTVMQNQKKKGDDVVGGNNSVARSSFVDNS